MARFIKLILSATLSVSFSTATAVPAAIALSAETKTSEKPVSLNVLNVDSSSSKSETTTSSKSESAESALTGLKIPNPMPTAEAEGPSDSVPDLVTSIRSLERKVLGASPDSESIEDRLVAMEEKLFSKKLSGSLFERLVQIRQTLTARDATPVNDTVSKEAPQKEAPQKEAQREAQKETQKDAQTAAQQDAETVAQKDALTAVQKDAQKELPASPISIAPSAVADPKLKKSASVASGPSRAEQLYEAHKLFDDKNYKGARKAMEAFIARNPLVYNGYYLLGLIDLKEHEPSPEYNQFAYNQFLKAYNLAPASPDCEFVCRYVRQAVRSQQPPDPRSVAVSEKNNPIQALLNVGVNCFLRSDDADARDLFEFVVKYCPGGAASANYNLGAMAEKRGQLQQALALYRTALTASFDRDALLSYKMLRGNDVDELSAKLIRRSIQRLELKIKANDRTWTGNEQEKGAPVTVRCTINRLSPSSIWADITDAGDNRMQ